MDALSRTDKDRLDQADPGWENQTPVETPDHWAYDLDIPQHLYTYPPLADGTPLGVVTSFYPIYPTGINAAQEVTFAWPDRWVPILVEYVIHRAFCRNSEDPSDDARAEEALLRFEGALAAEVQALAAKGPRNKAKAIPGVMSK